MSAAVATAIELLHEVEADDLAQRMAGLDDLALRTLLEEEPIGALLALPEAERLEMLRVLGSDLDGCRLVDGAMCGECYGTGDGISGDGCTHYDCSRGTVTTQHPGVRNPKIQPPPSDPEDYEPAGDDDYEHWDDEEVLA